MALLFAALHCGLISPFLAVILDTNSFGLVNSVIAYTQQNAILKVSIKCYQQSSSRKFVIYHKVFLLGGSFLCSMFPTDSTKINRPVHSIRMY